MLTRPPAWNDLPAAVTGTEMKDSSRLLSLQQGHRSQTPRASLGHAHRGKSLRPALGGDRKASRGDRPREANAEPAPETHGESQWGQKVTLPFTYNVKLVTLAVVMRVMLPLMNKFCCSAHLNHKLKEEHMFKQDIFLKWENPGSQKTLKGLPGPSPA